MDIHSFLSQCAGQWFSQRSLYDFSQQVADHQKSELTVETLFSAGEEIQALLQTTPFQADQVLGALKLTWDTSVDWGKPKQTGSQWYLFLASAQPNQGQLWRSPTTSGEPAGQGSYALNPDESLVFALNFFLSTLNNGWFAALQWVITLTIPYLVYRLTVDFRNRVSGCSISYGTALW